MNKMNLANSRFIASGMQLSGDRRPFSFKRSFYFTVVAFSTFQDAAMETGQITRPSESGTPTARSGYFNVCSQKSLGSGMA